MERMNRRTKSYVLLAVVVLLVALTTTCQDPTGLIRSVEVSVMAANDKFLRVVSLTPANQSLDVNPAQDITIQFDRAIEEATLAGNVSVKRADTGIVFSNWISNYENSTRTLKLQLSQPLTGNTPYTITITRGVVGSDGSQLMQQGSYSFTTADVPTALFCFGSDAANPLQYVNATISNPPPVTITIEAGSIATLSYLLTDSESVASNPASAYENVTQFSFSAPSVPSMSDGNHTLYLRLKDRSTNSILPFTYQRSILVDRTPPTISFDASSSDVIAYEKVYWKWFVSDPGTYASGLDTWYYRYNSGSWTSTLVTSYTYTKWNKTFGAEPVAGSSYLLEVYAVDRAGNQSSTDAYTIDLTSAEPIIPLPGAAFVSRTPSADWPDYPGASFYLVFVGTRTGVHDLSPVGSTATSGVAQIPAELAANTTYYWGYSAGVGVYPKSYRILYESPDFHFTTGSK